MKELLQLLSNLEGKKIEPTLVQEVLQQIDFKKIDYKQYLQGHDLSKYNKILVSESPLQVFIMSWPPQFLLPIHQHNNFWGYVIPLQGVVAETLYGFAPRKRKIYLHPTKTFKPGEIIYEPFNAIHKLQNTSPLEGTISLHIYYPAKYDYKGTMIFDAQNRRLAVLNEKAPGLSWDLPIDNYEIIEESAYDVEKLW